MHYALLPQTQLIINMLGRAPDDVLPEGDAIRELLRLCMSLTQKRPRADDVTTEDVDTWEAALDAFVQTYRNSHSTTTSKIWEHIASMITNTPYSGYLDVIGYKHIAHSAFARNEVLKQELNALLDACMHHQHQYKECIYAT